MKAVSTMSPAARRGRAMMLGGLALAHLTGMCVGLAGLFSGGVTPLVSTLIGLAVVIVFYSVGQAIELIALELPGFTGMSVVLASYAVRVIGIGALLAGIFTRAGDALSPTWVAAGLVAAVLGWTTGVVLVASHQRVPIFDHDYVPPTGPERP